MLRNNQSTFHEAQTNSKNVLVNTEINQNILVDKNSNNNKIDKHVQVRRSSRKACKPDKLDL